MSPRLFIVILIFVLTLLAPLWLIDQLGNRTIWSTTLEGIWAFIWSVVYWSWIANHSKY